MTDGTRPQRFVVKNLFGYLDDIIMHRKVCVELNGSQTPGFPVSSNMKLDTLDTSCQSKALRLMKPRLKLT